ncbi:hypothetical protein [Tenacibaculum discolor]|uniref:hypothetical protein n=1 Tax=Tenacibaculum discolor TaxID=361581 RepID=UPI000F590754|nr:hypothetical protein [Tenacibaculum discolor]
MKDLIKVVLKALSVSLLLSFYCCITSCKTSKEYNTNNKNYKIERYKSKGLFTGVTVKTYDNIKKELLLPSTKVINNVYLEGTVFSLGLGKHNLSILYPSKQSIDIKLLIKEKDSIVVKAHLPDENIVD